MIAGARNATHHRGVSNHTRSQQRGRSNNLVRLPLVSLVAGSVVLAAGWVRAQPAAATTASSGAPAVTETTATELSASTPAGSDAAAASEPGQPQVSLRSLGWSVPFGRLDAGGGKLSDISSGVFPFVIDIGLKLRRWLVGGLYLGYSPGVVGGSLAACGAIGSCSTASFRFGAQIQVHWLPGSRWNPWISYGAGFESLQLLIDTDTSSGQTQQAFKLTFRGAELAHLSLGLDRRFTDVIGLGPFVSVSVGSFSSASGLVVGGTTVAAATQADERALHGWVTAGLRTTLFP